MSIKKTPSPLLVEPAYTLPVTEQEMLDSYSLFDTVMLQGEQYYVLTDPTQCRRWWVYFWKLRYDQGWFQRYRINVPSEIDSTMPVMINLRTLELSVPHYLSRRPTPHLMYVDVSMGTLLFLYSICVGLYLWLCPVPLNQRCQIKAPVIKSDTVKHDPLPATQ